MEIDDGPPPAIEVPWYRGSKDTLPFSLAKVISSDNRDAPPFYCSTTFPWSQDSFNTLWDGIVTDESTLSAWKETAQAYTGAIAVGSKGRLYVFPRVGAIKPFCIQLPQDSLEVHCTAWALFSATDPLVVCTAGSLIFILNVKTHQVVGQLRGHGGTITSLCVHPTHPTVFCTTSRDFTARLYDLSYRPLKKPNNMHWPPDKKPSLAGPAHGLQMTEPEGEGIGQCLAVFVGGRSGGHRAAVLCAAFHRSDHLLATCGMDRAVKIWRIPPLRPGVLAREDKPLFSTDFIHKARVLSIAWLSHDILISHCAPALMRKKNLKLAHENGTVTIWRWLGYDRFFPPNIRETQKVMRGCANDWRGSESFKIISSYFLPMTTLAMHVYQSDGHDPLIIVPMGKCVRVVNITNFGPRAPLPFPLDQDVAELTQQLQLNEPAGAAQAGVLEQHVSGSTQMEEAEEQAENEDDEPEPDIPYSTQPSSDSARLKELFDSVDFWELTTNDAASRMKDLPDINACEMAFDGRTLFGVGNRGTLYVWRRDTE